MCGSEVIVQRTYNHFAIREVLGRGGMGAVYRAEDLKLKRMVALKILRRDIGQESEHRAQLENEARITASINHPHVVKVYTFGEDHGQFYLAMELVDKGSLDDLMSIQNRVAEAQVLEVGIQIAQGLRAATEVGLIHRDVKPGNILFSEPHTAKIVDFGLALLMEKEAEARGEIWGTPYYIAPEKLNHEAEDFRSDIYSLGGTLFHALAGRPPFEAESASLVALKHLQSKAVSLQAFAPDVSSQTAFVINRMLERNPEERYQSYDELVEHLQFASDSLQERLDHPRSKKERVVVETDLSKKIMGWLTLFTLLAIVGTIAAFGFILFTDSSEQSTDPEPDRTPGMVLTVTDFRESLDPMQREQHDEAMRLLADGRFEAAQQGFMHLADAPETPQPARNWFRLLAATAALFHGERGIAYQLLQKLSEEAIYSNRQEDLSLADFFKRAGVLLADNDTILPEELARFQTQDGQALLILLAGLNNWHNGHMPEGAEVLQMYLDTETTGQLAWINHFREPVQEKLKQRERVLAIEQEAEAVSTAEELDALNAQLEEMEAQLDAMDALRLKIDEVKRFISTKKRVMIDQARRKEAERRAAELAAQEAARQERLEAQDAPAWEAATASAHAAIQAYQFEEAENFLRQVPLQSQRFQEEQLAHLKRIQELDLFLKGVTSRVQIEPYPQLVVTRQGARYDKGLSGFSNGNFLSETPYGALEIPLIDLAPETLIAIAGYYATSMSGAMLAKDQLRAALFATEMGMNQTARQLASAAAQADPALQPLAANLEPLLRH